MEEAVKAVENVKISAEAETAPQEEVATSSDPAKRLRALRKKLKQIEEIEQKEDKSTLTPEQVTKMEKKGEVEEEIKQIESLLG